MVQKKTAEKALMRISAAAADAGVGRQTVEYYCLLGLISPIRRPGRSGRFFDKEIVKRIRLIHRLNVSGYTLRDIRETYLDPPRKRGEERREKREERKEKTNIEHRTSNAQR